MQVKVKINSNYVFESVFNIEYQKKDSNRLIIQINLILQNITIGFSIFQPCMPDIYNLYKDLERDDIILSFKGAITQDLLTSVFGIMESRLEQESDKPHLKKKFYHILIECLQNLYHHNEELSVDETSEDEDTYGSAIFMIGRGENGSFKIITGNFVMNTNTEELKSKIDKVNSMSADELRAFYLDKLSSTEISEKGGAGLGMIDIARKSGHKIDYSFHKASEKYSFFSLAVTVK
jgi:hypothetical protein